VGFFLFRKQLYKSLPPTYLSPKVFMRYKDAILFDLFCFQLYCLILKNPATNNTLIWIVTLDSSEEIGYVVLNGVFIHAVNHADG